MPTLRNASRWLLPALAVGALVVGCSKNDTTTTGGSPTTTAAAGSSTTAAKTGSSTASGGDYGKGGSSGTTMKTGGSTPAGAASVKLASSEFGEILVDGEGRTLYLFKKDTGAESTCTGGCTTAWPAFAGPATAGDGVDAGDLGVNGTKQVTFYGHPLYHFSGDEKAGEVNGQGVGDVWFAVDAEGNPVAKK